MGRVCEVEGSEEWGEEEEGGERRERLPLDCPATCSRAFANEESRPVTVFHFSSSTPDGASSRERARADTTMLLSVPPCFLAAGLEPADIVEALFLGGIVEEQRPKIK
jgi:hypothetical protein